MVLFAIDAILLLLSSLLKWCYFAIDAILLFLSSLYRSGAILLQCTRNPYKKTTIDRGVKCLDIVQGTPNNND